jgi:hypothetical protein
LDFGAFFATYLIVILFFNGLLALIPAYIASEKGRSFGAFWVLSFFTTIFVGLIAVLALPQVEKEARTVRTDERGTVLADETEMPDAIKCPFCAEIVKSEASICRYCQKDISNHIESLKAQIIKNREEIASETAAREHAYQMQVAARKAGLARVARNPVTWICTAGIIVGGISFAVFQETERVRVANLLSPNCSIREESLEIYFNKQMNVRFSLPTECGDSLGTALEEGLVSAGPAIGVIELEVFLDGVSASTLEVIQSIEEPQYIYDIQIPNEVFWDYSTDDDGAIAQEVKVALTYVSQLQETPTVELAQEIPQIVPEVSVGPVERSDSHTSKKYDYEVHVRLRTYQVPDFVEFDWPGDAEDRKAGPKSIVRLTDDFANPRGWGYWSLWFPSNEESVTLEIRIVQDKKVIQTINREF